MSNIFHIVTVKPVIAISNIIIPHTTNIIPNGLYNILLAVNFITYPLLKTKRKDYPYYNLLKKNPVYTRAAPNETRTVPTESPTKAESR